MNGSLSAGQAYYISWIVYRSGAELPDVGRSLLNNMMPSLPRTSLPVCSFKSPERVKTPFRKIITMPSNTARGIRYFVGMLACLLCYIYYFVGMAQVAYTILLQIV